MASNGQHKGTFLHMSNGDEQIMDQLREQFPDAVAAAHRQIAAVMPGSASLIARFTPEQLDEDRSDEIAIVGKLKK